MKIYAIYGGWADGEPNCYVEAKDIDDLVNIMQKREIFGMFPGWCPVEISKQEMYQILNRFNENDIHLVDEDKREDFNLFARMQFDDKAVIDELKRCSKLYKHKYSVSNELYGDNECNNNFMEQKIKSNKTMCIEDKFNIKENLFEEEDFIKRLKMSVSDAWKIFQFKAGNEIITINKEASMQLQYANILQNLIPLIIYNSDEKVEIKLEETKTLDNGNACEIDVFVVGRKNTVEYTIAIEMKCYKENTATGGKRGATDIFMKDVYVDIEKLERYISHNICQDKFFLAMTNLNRLVYPKVDKTSKCWNYDISDGYYLTPKTIDIPIGGKPQFIKISNEYIFNWIKRGDYYFLEL